MQCNALMLELSGNPNILQYSDKLLVLSETAQEALLGQENGLSQDGAL